MELFNLLNVKIGKIKNLTIALDLRIKNKQVAVTGDSLNWPSRHKPHNIHFFVYLIATTNTYVRMSIQ